MMQSKKKFAELSYNVQLSVSKNQIIVANDVCQDKHDAHQFVPQVKNIRDTIELPKDTKVGLDSGYSNGDNIKFAEDEEIDLYVPSRAQAQILDDKERSLNHDNYEYNEEKDELIVKGKRFSYRGFYRRKDGRKDGRKIKTFYSTELKKKKDVPFYFRERLRMKNKMQFDEAKKVYSLRKITVEPVYGHMKQNLGFREFLLRGLEKVKIEMNLISIAHNLQKIHRMMGENKGIIGKRSSHFPLFRNFFALGI
jgi:transposase